MSRGIPQQCGKCHEAFIGSDCIIWPIICPNCKNKIQKELEKIPAEFRCARCHKDLRENASGDYRCDCFKLHSQIFSRTTSGGQFARTQIDYEGTRKD